MTWTRALLIMALAGFAAVSTSSQSNPAIPSSTGTVFATQTQDLTAAPAQQAKSFDTKADGDYVGSDTCVTCHEDVGRRFNRTAMGKAMAHPHTPDEAHGCESCHGAGRGHVEAGGGKDTIPVRFTEDSKNTVAEKNFACLQCHSRRNQLFWRGSPHESRAMACVDCHQAHQELRPPLSHEARFNTPLTENESLKETQPELCLRCHQMRRAQLQRSSHMPYR